MTRRMIHEDGIENNGQMGSYTIQEVHAPDEVIQAEVQPEEPSFHESEEPQIINAVSAERVRRPARQTPRRTLGDKLRTGWTITKTTAAIAGALLIAREIHEFGFSVESHEKTEVSAGPAHSDIRESVFVNLAEVRSTFPLTVTTLNNRPGPIDCGVSISMNKRGHEVTTITNAGVILGEVSSAKQEDGTYVIDVEGDMNMTPSFVDWTKTPILFDREIGTFDICGNLDEPNKAMDIAVVTTQLAGQLATACAVSSKEGERAIIAGIKQDERVHGNIPAGVPDEQIKVNFPDLDDQQDANYGRASQTFTSGVRDVIKKYETGNDEVDTNFEGIRDCSQHTFTFEEQS